jgi:hypothetical protein
MLAQPVAPGNGVTQQLADAVNGLATAYGTIAGLEAAEIVALDRAEGAYLAHDNDWFSRQQIAARQISAQEVPLLRGLQGQFNAVHDALVATGDTGAFTLWQLQAVQQSLPTDGLSAGFYSATARLGLSAPDIATLSGQMRDADASAAYSQSGGSLASALTPSGSVAAFQAAAETADAFARPEPNVGLTVTPVAAAHQIQATLTARDAACSADGQIQSLKVVSLANATVAIPGVGTISAPTAAPVAIPNQPSSVVITVQKLQAGQPAAVRLMVHDGCGDWPTFVGGGANAF